MNEDQRCPGCSESYTETAEHLPRILPCYHTLCESCIRVMLNKRFLFECPECKITHLPSEGVNSFPPNKYILAYLREQRCRASQVEAELIQKVAVDEGECQPHGRQKTLFCLEPECRMPICPLCLLRTHKTHDVVDIAEDHRIKLGELESKLKSVAHELQAKRARILEAKAELQRNILTCTNMVSAKDAESSLYLQGPDALIREASDKMKAATRSIEEEVMAIEDNLIVIAGIKDYMGSHDLTYEELTSCVDTVRAMELHAVSSDDGTRASVSKATYVSEGALLSHSCHSDMQETQTEEPAGIVDTLEPKEEQKRERAASASSSRGPILPVALVDRQTSPIDQYTVIRTINTKLDGISCISILSNNSVVVCGHKHDRHILAQYDLETRRGIFKFATFGHVEHSLKEEIEAVAEVLFEGRHCLAVSHRGKIDFHDLKNMKRVLHRFRVGKNLLAVPLRMCSVQSAPGTLLYTDCSSYTRLVRWLDCRVLPPMHAYGRNSTHTQSGGIWDMCLVEEPDRTLLVTTGIFAYNVQKDELEWSIRGKLAGMEYELGAWSLATDGRGHLYVCDTNNHCVQVFSTSGVYLGPAVREGEQGLGRPFWVRWYSHSNCLVVAHRKNLAYQISLIRVPDKLGCIPCSREPTPDPSKMKVE